MLMNENIFAFTPSDHPENPVNSLCGATDSWILGEPLVKHQRPELSSLVDELSGGNKSDVPTGELTTIRDKNVTIIDGAGYVLTARSTLRLKGGGGGEDGEASGSAYNKPSFQGRPATCIIKYKKFGEDDHSPDPGGFPCPHAADFEKYSEEVSAHISDTRAILEDMIVQTKVARRWQSTIGLQLDEILVSNNRLARTSFKVLGMWEKQRSELRTLQKHVKDLHSDMGALK